MTKFESLDEALSERSGPTVEEKKNLFPSAQLEQILMSLREKIDPGEIGQELADTNNARIEMELRRLQGAFPDEYKQYQTYYILKRGQIPDTVTKSDFPGSDSVIKFIDTL